MINRIIFLLTSILFLSVGALGQAPYNANAVTVAHLPAASSNAGKVYKVSDGTVAGDCTVGGGHAITWCRSNGSGWIPLDDRIPASTYASLAEAVIQLGAAPTTLIVAAANFPSGSVRCNSLLPCLVIVPSTLTLDFRGPGSVLVRTKDQVIIRSDGSGWPIKKIFENALLAPVPSDLRRDLRGPVSFGGNTSLREVSISWWGAVCDNSKDDTVAINAAFVAGSGFTVRSQANVICRVQSPKLQSHTVFRLGTNSMFKVRDPNPSDSPGLRRQFAALSINRCEFCIVDGGVFDGNSANQNVISSHGIVIAGGTHLQLLNGRTQNAKTEILRNPDGSIKGTSFGDGIFLATGALPPRVVCGERPPLLPCGPVAPEDVVVDKWTSTSNDRQAITIRGCTRCQFTNNNFLDTRIGGEGAGMDFEPQPNLPTERFEDLVVEGNTISGNVGPGILFANANHALYKKIQFVNNSIRNNGRTGLSVTGENTDDLVIADNTIEGNHGVCPKGEGASEAIGLRISNVERGASVTGNIIANNDCAGIFIAASSEVSLTHNRIYSNGNVGIRIRTDTSVVVTATRNRLEPVRLANLTISNNLMFNNGTRMPNTNAGLFIYGLPDKVVGWEISHNNFGNDASFFRTATQKDGIFFQHRIRQGVIVRSNTFTGLLGSSVVNGP